MSQHLFKFRSCGRSFHTFFSINKIFEQTNSVAELAKDEEIVSEVSVFEYVIWEE